MTKAAQLETVMAAIIEMTINDLKLTTPLTAIAAAIQPFRMKMPHFYW